MAFLAKKQIADQSQFLIGAATEANNSGTTTRGTATGRVMVVAMIVHSTGANAGGSDYSILAAGQVVQTGVQADLNAAGKQIFYDAPTVLESGETVQTTATAGDGAAQTNRFTFAWIPITNGATLA